MYGKTKEVKKEIDLHIRKNLFHFHSIPIFIFASVYILIFIKHKQSNISLIRIENNTDITNSNFGFHYIFAYVPTICCSNIQQI